MIKTRYELQQDLKLLIEETGLKTNISKLTKAQLEEEIKVQKIMIMNRAIRTERSKPGPLGPRKIETIQNEDGIEIPIIPEKSLSGPIEKRRPGRPKKEVIVEPTIPASRLETLRADSDEEEKKIVHIPPITSTRCTCLSCPVHNSTKRI